jgi:hypothetical protein
MRVHKAARSPLAAVSISLKVVRAAACGPLLLFVVDWIVVYGERGCEWLIPLSQATATMGQAEFWKAAEYE